MAATRPRVLVTGASGLLGLAVVAALAPDFDVMSAAYSRAGEGGVLKLDLTDDAATTAAMKECAPAIVINVAAERHPDVCEANAAATEALNVEAVWRLARLASTAHAVFIQISTDYLWRGDAAPYNEVAPPSPPNEYGRQKLRGEYAALAAHGGAYVLRVPVLFGPTADLSESAVTMFAATVMNRGKTATVDDWQIRVPTYTCDVGATLSLMCAAALAARLAPGIYHYSSPDRITRWGMCRMFAELLEGASVDHVTRLEGAPPGAPRPFDCQLAVHKLKAAGCFAPPTPLRAALAAVLRGAGLAVGGEIEPAK